MKSRYIATAILSVALVAPAASFSADGDTDRSHPMAFVKDSIITAKVKTKLAADKIASLVHVKVDTDAKGVVWLSGTARTQADIDKAMAIARGTEGVTSVTSDIKVKSDD